MGSLANPGKRPKVLVVEDEFIIALDLSDTVRTLGYALDGPYPDNENAFVAIDREMPDIAILDVCTGDGEVYPLADALTEAGVPIIFHSGHASYEEMHQRYPDAIACAKPCSPDKLVEALQKASQMSPILRH